MFNAGQRIEVNNRNFGYLHHRIVFYLLNLHIKSRHTYFVRVSGRLKSKDFPLTVSRLALLVKKIHTKLTPTSPLKEWSMQES